MESRVFEDEIVPATENANHPAEEMPELHDRGINLIGTVRIELFAKSFILRVYDVLARHTRLGPGTSGGSHGPQTGSEIRTAVQLSQLGAEEAPDF
jgi:hypothetical protein